MHDAAAIAVQWAAEEGWNPGLDDGERFARADPGAFLCTERDGEVVATVSCARYGEAYAFIGMYIVRPDLRGQGSGGSCSTARSSGPGTGSWDSTASWSS